MFRCVLTVLSFTMSIQVVLVSFAQQRKRDPIHWEYCAHDVTQATSLLLKLKVIRYGIASDIFPPLKWYWVEKNVLCSCLCYWHAIQCCRWGTTYVNICILQVRNCTTILFSSDVPVFLFFSHSHPVNHAFVSPQCSGWQTKACMCSVFPVSHRVLPQPLLSY